MRFITIVLLVLFALLQYKLWVGNASLTEVHHLEQIKLAQIEENNRLQDRNQSLSAEVLDLKQGLEAVEERARSEMGMIKSNETFFQIVNKGSSSNIQTNEGL